MKATVLALGLLLLAGCSNVVRDEESLRGELLVVGPEVGGQLPYKLYVAVVTSASETFDEREPDRYGMAVDPKRIARDAGKALSTAFATVAVHEGDPERAKDAAFQGGFDFLLTMRVRQYDCVYVNKTAAWYPNAIFLHWYLYFPVWVIADEVYGVQTKVECSLTNVKNEAPFPGWENAHTVVVDSRAADVKQGEETPRGPRVQLDDLDRGIDLYRTYTPGELSRDQWAQNVQVLLEPYARRWVATSTAREVALSVKEARAQDGAIAAIGAIHAVLVGVKTYSGDDCPHADADALAMEAWLAGAPREGDTLVAQPGPRRAQPKLIRTLTNDLAEREAIEKAVGDIARAMRPEDTLVFFFSGRGAVGPKPGLAGLGLACASSSKQDAAGSAHVLGLDRLKELLDLSRGKTIVILDCAFGKGTRSTDARGQGELSALGSIFIAAAKVGQPALVLDASGHGLLTHAFLDGVQGGADPDATGLTWEKLGRHLTRAVRTLSQLAGDGADEQEPVVRLGLQGEVFR